MEPDIGAFEELYWNIKWNPDRAAKISLCGGGWGGRRDAAADPSPPFLPSLLPRARRSKTCISNQSSTLTMHGHPGDSSSSLFGPDPKQVGSSVG